MKEIELNTIQKLIDKVKQNSKYQFIYISRTLLKSIIANNKQIVFDGVNLIINNVRLKVVTSYFTTTDILLSE